MSFIRHFTYFYPRRSILDSTQSRAEKKKSEVRSEWQKSFVKRISPNDLLMMTISSFIFSPLQHFFYVFIVFTNLPHHFSHILGLELASNNFILIFFIQVRQRQCSIESNYMLLWTFCPRNLFFTFDFLISLTYFKRKNTNKCSVVLIPPLFAFQLINKLCVWKCDFSPRIHLFFVQSAITS